MAFSCCRRRKRWLMIVRHVAVAIAWFQCVQCSKPCCMPGKAFVQTNWQQAEINVEVLNSRILSTHISYYLLNLLNLVISSRSPSSTRCQERTCSAEFDLLLLGETTFVIIIPVKWLWCKSNWPFSRHWRFWQVYVPPSDEDYPWWRIHWRRTCRYQAWRLQVPLLPDLNTNHQPIILPTLSIDIITMSSSSSLF